MKALLRDAESGMMFVLFRWSYLFTVENILHAIKDHLLNYQCMQTAYRLVDRTGFDESNVSFLPQRLVERLRCQSITSSSAKAGIGDLLQDLTLCGRVQSTSAAVCPSVSRSSIGLGARILVPAATRKGCFRTAFMCLRHGAFLR
jgi:hypothetical protein